MTNVVTPGAWLVLHVAGKHRLVQAPGPGLTVVFLTFRVLAQGGGGGYIDTVCPRIEACVCLGGGGGGSGAGKAGRVDPGR